MTDTDDSIMIFLFPYYMKQKTSYILAELFMFVNSE